MSWRESSLYGRPSLLQTSSSPATYGVAPITLSATGGASGNPVTFSIATGGSFGTLSGSNNSTLTITGAGTITIAANQAGNANYSAATQVTHTILVNGASQTVSFNAPSSPVIFGVSPVTLSATGGASGNAVTFSVVSGPGTIIGSTLTITGAGTTTIAANQAGSASYSAATQVTQSIVVNAASQTISFSPPSSPVIFGVSPITLSATGGASGNAVTFSVVSGPGTIIGSTLTITGVGTITIAANQAGSASYSAATQVTQSIVVNAAAPTIIFTISIAGASSRSLATSAPGGTAVYAFTLSPAGAATFPSTVVLSASGLPTGATYSFLPATLAAGSGTQTVALTIQLPQTAKLALPTGIHGSNVDDSPQASGNSELNTARRWAPFTLALLSLPFAGRMRKGGGKLGRLLSFLLLVLLGITTSSGLAGCGTRGSGFFGKPSQTYTVTVTGSSGGLSHSTSVTLTVE